MFEWAAAGDLKRQIRKAQERKARFDERVIWKYFAQICDAIAHMHHGRRQRREHLAQSLLDASMGHTSFASATDDHRSNEDDGAEGHPVPPRRGHVGHLEQTVDNLITLRHFTTFMVQCPPFHLPLFFFFFSSSFFNFFSHSSIFFILLFIF